MAVLEWISQNKETIAWIFGSAIAVHKVSVKGYRKYKKIQSFVSKVSYEINNNGGKSMKDLAEKTASAIESMVAMQDAILEVDEKPIFKCNNHGFCVFANDSLCELYGATPDEMMGFGWLNFVKDTERDAAEKSWKRNIASSSHVTYDYTVINGQTGEEIPVYYRAAIKRGGDGKIISILGMVYRKN